MKIILVEKLFYKKIVDIMKEIVYINFQLPTEEEFLNYAKLFPVEKISVFIDGKYKSSILWKAFDTEGLKKAALDSELNTWYSNLKTLLFELRFSYGFLRYFYNSGIPDDEVTDETKSIYFPNFDPQHFYNLGCFSYFAEIMFVQFFSYLDNLAAIYVILNSPEKVRPSKIYFNERTFKSHKNYQVIREILDDPIFKKARQIRNDIVHNRSPFKLYSQLSISRNENGLAFGSEISYLKSKEVMHIIDHFKAFVLPKATEIILNLS
ncbi:MAG: Cthe_2314 family HEPN domain-containing protein [Leptospiraceae bacterium]|nr:Cthe_2314 family HEPN domain-containing protein [Leptospiraceae bacterium]